MRQLGVFLVLSVTLGLSCLPAQADKAPNASTKASEQKVIPLLEGLVISLKKMYDARDSLTDFHAEYRAYSENMDDRGHPLPYTITVSGDLAKPNKMNLRLMHGTTYIGQIVCDGATTIYYNPRTKSYAQFPAAKLYRDVSLVDVAKQKLEEDKPGYKPPAVDVIAEQRKQDEAKDEALNVFEPLTRFGVSDALNATEFLLRETGSGEWGDLGMAFGQNKHFKMNAPGSDRQVEVIDLFQYMNASGDFTDQEKGAAEKTETHFAFDAMSGMPLEYRSVNTINMPPGAHTKLINADYKFTSIVPASATYPSATFAWTIPDGAKLYHKPKETDPFANFPK